MWLHQCQDPLAVHQTRQTESERLPIECPELKPGVPVLQLSSAHSCSPAHSRGPCAQWTSEFAPLILHDLLSQILACELFWGPGKQQMLNKCLSVGGWIAW